MKVHVLNISYDDPIITNKANGIKKTHLLSVVQRMESKDLT